MPFHPPIGVRYVAPSAPADDLDDDARRRFEQLSPAEKEAPYRTNLSVPAIALALAPRWSCFS